ncbi:two component, sigma54 specific, transcriptional regulator, Fis family protein [Enhygromyxa salina]|uniref:Two component, sigma54 specific, transcriptional regulator, Fis family protein n=1 Tax=Enhygromyxa salina TaxID=215803 RepID=A0A0C2CZ65_9BACT|nr:sigma 54-interacting transcriptional regulator [Enhygromyxa salina]KIG14935.1 two component, sigma54 specific, transcriptional regulator, Fis family protein [Enhygromyxa salina]
MSPSEHTNSTVPSRTHPAARRPGRLRVRVDAGPVIDVALDTSAAVTFGRSRAAQVVISDQSVSKVHFSLRAVDGGVELEDLGSKNGTWVGERRVRRMTLLPGDRLWAGEVCLQLIDVDHVDVEVAPAHEWGLLHGHSVVMRELFATLAKLASAPADVLIQGEPGTGKELAARSIHRASARSEGPFVVLDCAALPLSLADPLLFGFCRSAFPDADADRAGVFEQANGGTLLIDDIDRLAPELQSKLLRVLEQRRVCRLGQPDHVRDLDVRVIAISRRDLASEVRAKRLREELLLCIAHASVRLPALRERDQDMFMLAQRILSELAAADQPCMSLADDAMALMGAYDWPGNVRELDHTIRRSALACRDRVIRSEDLEFGAPRSWAHKLNLDGPTRDYDTLHEAVDRLYLPRVLAECKTISAGARQLGITRDRLRGKLRALGLWGDSESVRP